MVDFKTFKGEVRTDPAEFSMDGFEPTGYYENPNGDRWILRPTFEVESFNYKMLRFYDFLSKHDDEGLGSPMGGFHWMKELLYDTTLGVLYHDPSYKVFIPYLRDHDLIRKPIPLRYFTERYLIENFFDVSLPDDKLEDNDFIEENKSLLEENYSHWKNWRRKQDWYEDDLYPEEENLTTYYWQIWKNYVNNFPWFVDMEERVVYDYVYCGTTEHLKPRSFLPDGSIR